MQSETHDGNNKLNRNIIEVLSLQNVERRIISYLMIMCTNCRTTYFRIFLKLESRIVVGKSVVVCLKVHPRGGTRSITLA
jgi:hypothetical protein